MKKLMQPNKNRKTSWDLCVLVFLFSIISFGFAPYSFRQIAALAPEFRNWGLQNSIGNSHIHAVDAWKLAEGSRDIIVAVIDTGIDATHPDIKNNLWKHPVYGYYGWDFVANKPNPKDDHGHGTHVAGILGAALNQKAGIAGVAHKVSIMAVKYYSERNSGSENLRNSIKALNWAIENGAQIINYSGGGPERSTEELMALKRARDKGILLVSAAGNERHDADQESSAYYPCSYRLENTICVASLTIRNELLGSSNWGKRVVDIAAPGENILSTIPNGKYDYMSGTSQATAFVSGLAALILSKNRSMKPEEVRELIRASADKLPNLKEKVLSGGKVNAFAALSMLESRKKLKKSDGASDEISSIRKISSKK